MTVRQTNVIWVAFVLADSLLLSAAHTTKQSEYGARHMDCIVEELEGPGEWTRDVSRKCRLMSSSYRLNHSWHRSLATAAVVDDKEDRRTLLGPLWRILGISKVERRDRARSAPPYRC